MRRISLQSLALLAFVATPCIATPAFAGSPFYDAPEMAQGMTGAQTPTVRRRAGHFLCSYRELHTRLERKNCR